MKYYTHADWHWYPYGQPVGRYSFTPSIVVFDTQKSVSRDDAISVAREHMRPLSGVFAYMRSIRHGAHVVQQITLLKRPLDPWTPAGTSYTDVHVVRDLSDPHTEVLHLNMHTGYDMCGRIERITGDCALCPEKYSCYDQRGTEGFPDWLLPQLGRIGYSQTLKYPWSGTATIQGYRFCPPGHVRRHDDLHCISTCTFTDEHINMRKSAYLAEAQHRKELRDKNARLCGECVMSNKGKRCDYRVARHCTVSLTPLRVQRAVEELTPVPWDIPGFTTQQRDLLMRHADGSVLKCTWSGGPANRGKGMLGYFAAPTYYDRQRSGFYVSNTVTGKCNAYVLYRSWDELTARVPAVLELPPVEPVPDKLLRAYYILAANRRYRINGWGASAYRSLGRVRVQGDGVLAYTCTSYGHSEYPRAEIYESTAASTWAEWAKELVDGSLSVLGERGEPSVDV